MEAYARICGQTVGRAPARTGDSIAIGAYLGSGDSFERAIADFSEASPSTTSATTASWRWR